jgi:sec-independent protein translocase protein TatB
MFDIGWSEILVIAVVALVVIGPKELPEVIRGIGRTVAKLRSMAAEFQGQFNQALHEADLGDLKKNVDDIRAIANPLQTLKDEVRTSIESAVAAAEAKPAAPAPEAPPAETAPEPPGAPLDLAPPAASAELTPAPAEPAAAEPTPVEPAKAAPEAESKPA